MYYLQLNHSQIQLNKNPAVIFLTAVISDHQQLVNLIYTVLFKKKTNNTSKEFSIFSTKIPLSHLGFSFLFLKYFYEN